METLLMRMERVENKWDRSFINVSVGNVERTANIIFSTRWILVLELGHGLLSSSLVQTKQILSGEVTTEDEVERTRKQEEQEERLKSKKLITETRLRRRSGRRSHQDPIQSFRSITLHFFFHLFPLSFLYLRLFSIIFFHLLFHWLSSYSHTYR